MWKYFTNFYCKAHPNSLPISFFVLLQKSWHEIFFVKLFKIQWEQPLFSLKTQFHYSVVPKNLTKSKFKKLTKSSGPGIQHIELITK